MAEESEAGGENSVDNMVSLLPIYLEGDTLALCMEMNEDNQKDINLIEAHLKEVFIDGLFTAYKKLTMIRWTSKRVDVCTNRIRQLAGMAGFEGVGLERLS